MNLFWLKKYNLLSFNEIDSTNSEAMRFGQILPAGNYVIWAQSQTSGRGRHSKVWVSLPGNLYFSILLNKNIELAYQPQLSFVTALVVLDTILELANQCGVNFNTQLKWPNDVLVDGKKIAGILLESLNFKGNSSLIIGIGINIKTFPKNVDQPVTSLVNEDVSDLSTWEVLNICMNYFDERLIEWQKSGFVKTRKSWLNNVTKLGEIITIDDGNNKISGIFKDIDLNGGIRIQTSEGQIFTCYAGQVSWGEKINE